MQDRVEHLLSFCDVQVSNQFLNLIFNSCAAARRNFERRKRGVVSVGKFVIGQIFVLSFLLLPVGTLYGSDVGNGLLSPQPRIFKASNPQADLELFRMLGFDVITVALRPGLSAASERAQGLF
jgi:hypothetical protein